LHDTKPVPPHPQQKSLLPFCADVYAGVEEGAQKPTVAEQDPEQFIVINIYRVKPGRVKKIVSVNKDGYASAMSELPGRSGSRVELHFGVPQTSRI